MDRPPLARRSAVTLVGAALVVTGCAGGRAPDAAPTPCPSPSPVSPALLPKRVPLGRWGTITEVSERAGFIGAEAVTDELIIVLYPEIVRTMRARGYTLLGGDNEGFEAELTFSDRGSRLTTFTLQQGRCEQVIVRTLIEMKEE